MIELIEMLTIGFAVGLSGALIPGPMLFATIDGSMKKGWICGPKVVLGHALLELVLCILIVFGITALLGKNEISAISVLGGAVLILFGIFTIKDARRGALSMGNTTDLISANPVAVGFITSVSNPYFWIWWLAEAVRLCLKVWKLACWQLLYLCLVTGWQILAGLALCLLLLVKVKNSCLLKCMKWFCFHVVYFSYCSVHGSLLGCLHEATVHSSE